MRLVLNVLWVIFGGGFITALQYVLSGLLLCVTIVGIPFGLQCFKLAGLVFFPFGKDFDQEAFGVFSTVFNVVWLVFAGIWIFATHVALAIPLFISIIGIPFGFQHLKFATLALWPFGAQVRNLN